MSQIVWSPLAQGVLTGKYRPGSPAPADSRATSGSGANFIRRFLRDEVLEPVEKYATICREAGHTPAAVALAWVLRNPNVASAIVGASRPEQVTENVKALDIRLSDDLVTAIEEALAPVTVNDPALTVSPPGRS